MTAEITKIQTTSDMAVRLTVEIDKDMAPADIFTWLHKIVEIKVVGVNNEGN
jgi:hypothetical protein